MIQLGAPVQPVRLPPVSQNHDMQTIQTPSTGWDLLICCAACVSDALCWAGGDAKAAADNGPIAIPEDFTIDKARPLVLHPGDLKMLFRQDARYAGTAAWLGSGCPMRHGPDSSMLQIRSLSSTSGEGLGTSHWTRRTDRPAKYL